MTEIKATYGETQHPKQELLDHLESLRLNLVRTSLWLQAEGIDDKAEEMAGASGMLASWIEGIREDYR